MLRDHDHDDTICMVLGGKELNNILVELFTTDGEVRPNQKVLDSYFKAS